MTIQATAEVKDDLPNESSASETCQLLTLWDVKNGSVLAKHNTVARRRIYLELFLA